MDEELTKRPACPDGKLETLTHRLVGERWRVLLKCDRPAALLGGSLVCTGPVSALTLSEDGCLQEGPDAGCVGDGLRWPLEFTGFP